ncbi:MAG: hypothetical protein NW214_00145 [Pseudanabaenaceae cyanobacterium bins.39]|nr:hypothetical protein [Pseudanabaenaceae cyanobacterium bins.39]
MRSLPACEEQKNDKKIVLQESKSKITFLNPNQDKVLVIEIDGCVITDDNILRCDYAIVPCDEVEIYEIYIELKGSGILHAVKQIESTINLLSDNPKKIRKLCFIVSTRVPKQTTSVQQLQSQFKKKFNAGFRIKNIQDVYDLSTFIGSK